MPANNQTLRTHIIRCTHTHEKQTFINTQKIYLSNISRNFVIYKYINRLYDDEKT